MITFKEYKTAKTDWQSWHGPVYKVQCYSVQIAKELTGNHSDVLRVDMSEHYHYPPPFNLRLLKPFRTLADQQFRDQVAANVREQRA